MSEKVKIQFKPRYERDAVWQTADKPQFDTYEDAYACATSRDFYAVFNCHWRVLSE